MTDQIGSSGSQPDRGDGEVLVAGRRVYLRAVRPQDYELLYVTEMDPSALPFYRHKGTTPAPEAFASTLWNGVSVQFALAARSDNRLLGLSALYAYDARNGVAKMAAILLPDVRKLGWPTEGLGLFIDYAFHALPLRKIYADTPAPVADLLERSLEGVASVEGRLVAHEWMAGRYVDVLSVAVHRARWMSSDNRRRLRSPLGSAGAAPLPDES